MQTTMQRQVSPWSPFLRQVSPFDLDEEVGEGMVDAMLPTRSPLVGFFRHSPPQAAPSQANSKAMYFDHFDQLLQWRSKHGVSHDSELDKEQPLKLPRDSPYVGSQRHAPPSPCISPMLCFKLPMPEFALDLPEEEESAGPPPAAVLGQLPDEAWSTIFSMAADVPRIGTLSSVARGFSDLLKSELVWAGRRFRVPPAGLPLLAPVLGEWLPAWRLVSKLVIPRSNQLMSELQERAPDLPIEVAWRFDPQLKGQGVQVVNHGRSVRRKEGAEEELVVLGDAPVPLNEQGVHWLEVTLDDRSAEAGGDNLNDFGIGVTARPPATSDDLAVAAEVPMSWVIDFTKNSIVLSVNNREVTKGLMVDADDIEEGDKVALCVTSSGCFEIFVNGELRESLVPEPSDRVPRGVELFPVLDLYGCTAQLSRTDIDVQ